MMEFIANPAKWDYSGLLSKEDKTIRSAGVPDR